MGGAGEMGGTNPPGERDCRTIYLTHIDYCTIHYLRVLIGTIAHLDVAHFQVMLQEFISTPSPIF